MMHPVVCPICKDTRAVSKKKTWMVGDPPYEGLCKKCCQIGKTLSEETKDKLRVNKPEGFSEMVSEQHKKQPHLKDTLIPGYASGWNKGLELVERSEETKEKISKSTIGKKKPRKKESDQ